MKMFPKLANKTNLSPEELQAYYSIRFNFIQPYNEGIKTHEKSLTHLGMALLRAGKVKYTFKDAGESVVDTKRAAAPSSSPNVSAASGAQKTV